jgi:non-ribosomal peptide synthetase component E (peptide arylation enzyme)
MSHCRTDLPNYMIPDQITFIDAVPKNAGVGKVNYEKLKQMAQDELKLIGEGAAHV